MTEVKRNIKASVFHSLFKFTFVLKLSCDAWFQFQYLTYACFTDFLESQSQF